MRKLAKVLNIVALCSMVVVSTHFVQAANLSDSDVKNFLSSISQMVSSLSSVVSQLGVPGASQSGGSSTVPPTPYSPNPNIPQPVRGVLEAAHEAPQTVPQIARTLDLGDTGQDVAILQQFLASKPGVYPEGLVTGNYLNLTMKAVSVFQTTVGLPPVGRVGPKTLPIVNAELARATLANTEFAEETTEGTSQLSLTEYTVQFLNAVNDLQLAPPSQKSLKAFRLKEIAEQRKQTVLEEIKTNPRSVIQNVIPASAVSKLSSEVRNLVEQALLVEGRFEYLHGDNFENNTSIDNFFVTESSTGKRYQVYFPAGDIPHAATDDKVRISGIAINNGMAALVESVTIVAKAQRPVSFSFAKTALAQTVINKKVIAILVNFLNSSLSVTPATVFNILSGTVKNYFQENSFFQWNFGGVNNPNSPDVVGPYLINYDSTVSGCATFTIESLANSAAQAAGISLSGYDNLIYIFPSAPCGASGFGSIGGYPGRVDLPGGINASTAIHELGHNYYMNHASSYRCTENGVSVPISTAGNCISGEYGDPFDVMGGGGTKHFNNYHKGTYGAINGPNWLTPANTVTISPNTNPTGGIFNIFPIEQASAGIQALRIPRFYTSTGEVTSYYYVEFRKQFGFDNFSSTAPVVNGATVRFAPDYFNDSSVVAKTKLIDTIPSTSSFTDAPLTVGHTFNDLYAGITISTLSVTPSSVQVQVSFGALPCVHGNPSLAISPISASVYAGQSQSFSYTLTNNDTTSCSASNFTITPTLPLGFTQSPSPINYSLAPATSISGTFIVSAPADAAATSYSITETAQNTSTAGYQATTAITLTILPADTISPTVTINTPANGATVSSGNIKFKATASDQSGIAQIKLFVDSVLKKTCNNVTTCSVNVSANSLSTAAHILTAQATDNGGPVANTASASITIFKQ